MTDVENDGKVPRERRKDKRVSYTAILGFEELHGRQIPSSPRKPNATGKNLSLAGICFLSERRPQTELIVLYLPDGARAVAHVVDISQEVDASKYLIHCQVQRWLPDGVTAI